MTPDTATIKCPRCKAPIKLTDAMQEGLRAQFDADLEKARLTIAAEERTKAMTAAEEAGRDARQEALKRAIEAGTEANTLREANSKLNAKLAAAQSEQARLLLKESELDSAKREMELTIAKQVAAGAALIREQARMVAQTDMQLTVAAKDEQLRSLTDKIEELKRRAEQGDNRVQGEAQELVLEQMLRARFPLDTIEPVGKGVNGGDVLQRVVGPSGQQCGSILWESKRTKTWGADWLSKLRTDQRTAKADIALLVTQTMPKRTDGGSGTVYAFDLIDGVWVAEWQCAIPIAVALRQSLIALAGAKLSQEGQAGKMEIMYAYLTGPRFKMRVQAIVEKFGEMAEDLRKERAATTRLWAKREGQIQGAADAASGMYGDLEGIAGAAIMQIDGLTLQIEAGK